MAEQRPVKNTFGKQIEQQTFQGMPVKDRIQLYKQIYENEGT